MYKIHKNECHKFTAFHNRKKAADPKTSGYPLALNDRAQDKDRSDATERDVDVDIYAHIEP